MAIPGQYTLPLASRFPPNVSMPFWGLQRRPLCAVPWPVLVHTVCVPLHSSPLEYRVHHKRIQIFPGEVWFPLNWSHDPIDLHNGTVYYRVILPDREFPASQSLDAVQKYKGIHRHSLKIPSPLRRYIWYSPMGEEQHEKPFLGDWSRGIKHTKPCLQYGALYRPSNVPTVCI